MQFAKLFNSILDSTIWQEAKETKLLWITMLAMSDRKGEVHASIPGLAVRAGISIDECKAALNCLLSPDEYSRTATEGGRRIRPMTSGGGWELINHGKYRDLLSAEERKEYNRAKQAECRERKRAELMSMTVNDASMTVNDCQSQSSMSAHTESDGESDSDATPKQTYTCPAIAEDIGLEVEESAKPFRETDPIRLRLLKLYNRRTTKPMPADELKAIRKADIQEEDLAEIESYYGDRHPEWNGEDFRRRNLITLLNNWQGEVDKAAIWKAGKKAVKKVSFA